MITCDLFIFTDVGELFQVFVCLYACLILPREPKNKSSEIKNGTIQTKYK